MATTGGALAIASSRREEARPEWPATAQRVRRGRHGLAGAAIPEGADAERAVRAERTATVPATIPTLATLTTTNPLERQESRRRRRGLPCDRRPRCPRRVPGAEGRCRNDARSRRERATLAPFGARSRPARSSRRATSLSDDSRRRSGSLICCLRAGAPPPRSSSSRCSRTPRVRDASATSPSRAARRSRPRSPGSVSSSNLVEDEDHPEVGGHGVEHFLQIRARTLLIEELLRGWERNRELVNVPFGCHRTATSGAPMLGGDAPRGGQEKAKLRAPGATVELARRDAEHLLRDVLGARVRNPEEADRPPDGVVMAIDHAPQPHRRIDDRHGLDGRDRVRRTRRVEGGQGVVVAHRAVRGRGAPSLLMARSPPVNQGSNEQGDDCYPVQRNRWHHFIRLGSRAPVVSPFRGHAHQARPRPRSRRNRDRPPARRRLPSGLK